MRGFNIFLGIVILLFIVSILITIKIDYSILFQQVIINFIQLLILIFACHKATLVCKKHYQRKASSTLIILNSITSVLGVLVSVFIPLLIGFYLFYVKDWMMNIGGDLNKLTFHNWKLYALLIVPIITLLISKFVWNKKTN
jgi:hypothetical protein